MSHESVKPYKWRSVGYIGPDNLENVWHIGSFFVSNLTRGYPFFCNQITEEELHPCGQGGQAIAQIGRDDEAVCRIGEDGLKPLSNTRRVALQRIAQPM